MPTREAFRAEAFEIVVPHFAGMWFLLDHVGLHQRVAVAQVAGTVDRFALRAAVNPAVFGQLITQLVAAGRALGHPDSLVGWRRHFASFSLHDD